MKKFMKFGCLGFIGIIVLFVIIGIVGGGDDSDKVSTGGDSKKEGQVSNNEKKDDGTKKIDASAQQLNAAGLKVGLGEVKITDKGLEVGINLENTASQAIHFYPDQGSAVIGNMQLDANLFMTDGDIGGEIQPGVKQEAVIEFLVPDGKKLDVKTVQEIKIVFGDASTADFMTTKPVTFTIPVK